MHEPAPVDSQSWSAERTASGQSADEVPAVVPAVARAPRPPYYVPVEALQDEALPTPRWWTVMGLLVCAALVGGFVWLMRTHAMGGPQAGDTEMGAALPVANSPAPTSAQPRAGAQP